MRETEGERSRRERDTQRVSEIDTDNATKRGKG